MKTYNVWRNADKKNDDEHPVPVVIIAKDAIAAATLFAKEVDNDHRMVYSNEIICVQDDVGALYYIAIHVDKSYKGTIRWKNIENVVHDTAEEALNKIIDKYAGKSGFIPIQDLLEEIRGVLEMIDGTEKSA